jgi:4-hydroxybenzoate polyprenyltransferase
MIAKISPYIRLIRFDKPIGSLLLLWPTLIALLLASNGKPPILLLIVFTLATFLTRSFGCIINDLCDINIDKHVERTATRPLAASEITKTQAIGLAILLAAITYIMALLTLKHNTMLFCYAALVILCIYPLMKRIFFLPQLFLGVAFSFGIVVVSIEVLGHINLLMVLLFIANFMWVFGYDTIYALCDKDDDSKLNIYTSAITLGEYVNLVVLLCYIIYIIIFIIIGILQHVNFLYYIGMLYVAQLLGYQIYCLYKKRTAEYFQLFLLNNRVGLFTLISLILGMKF